MKHILKLSIITLAIILLSGCTDKENAKRILETEGYENITIGGWEFFTCTRDDGYRTSFTATKNGKRVDGVVCGDALGNSIVRIR